MKLDELKKKVPNFDWDAFFSAFTSVEISYIIVDNPEFYSTLNNLLENEDIKTWKIYLTGALLNGSASYLSSRFEQANFDFYGKVIRGTPEMEKRWKRVLKVLNNRFILGELVGKAYVEEYFPPEAKQQMLELVENLQ